MRHRNHPTSPWGLFTQSLFGKLFPFLTLLFGVMCDAVSSLYPFPEGQWMLLIILCWGIFRPSQLSVLLLLLFGICTDIRAGEPLGLNSLIFLLLHMSVIVQHHYLDKYPFLHVWALSGVILGCLLFLKGIFLLEIGGGALLSVIWKNWFVTILGMPLFYFTLGKKIERWSHGQL